MRRPSHPAAVILAMPPAPQSDADLEARYQDAVIALQEGKPDAALERFEWVLAQVGPTHVLHPLATYGAARAAAASTTPGHACTGETRVRAYLDRADAEPAKRTRLERLLPDLQTRCAAERPPPVLATTVPGPAPTPPAPPSADPVGLGPSASLDARLSRPVVEPAANTETLRRAGWISLAAGAALTAAGGYFWYAATQAQDDAEAATTIRAHGEHADTMETANGLALGLTLTGGLGLLCGSGLLIYTEAK